MFRKEKNQKNYKNSYKIVEEKNLKNTIKSCNTVQYVCLFTTLQVGNKDVCKIVKISLFSFNRVQIELYHRP